jgi:hypothetical protein
MSEGSGIVLCRQSQVKLIISQTVGFRALSKPREFEFMRGSSITEKNQYKALIRGLHPPGLDKAQGITIEIQTFLEIPDIDAVVIKAEFHVFFSNPAGCTSSSTVPPAEASF